MADRHEESPTAEIYNIWTPDCRDSPSLDEDAAAAPPDSRKTLPPLPSFPSETDVKRRLSDCPAVARSLCRPSSFVMERFRDDLLCVRNTLRRLPIRVTVEDMWHNVWELTILPEETVTFPVIPKEIRRVVYWGHKLMAIERVTHETAEYAPLRRVREMFGRSLVVEMVSLVELNRRFIHFFGVDSIERLIDRS
jgi:hypothetical protein